MMNIKLKQLSISLLFCLIFILAFNMNVFAIEGYPSPDGISFGSKISDEKISSDYKIETIVRQVRNDYCDLFKAMAEEKYANTNIIAKYTISNHPSRTYMYMSAEKSTISALFDFTTNFDDRDKEFTITCEIGGTEYKINSYATKVNLRFLDHIDEDDGTPVFRTEAVYKNDVDKIKESIEYKGYYSLTPFYVEIRSMTSTKELEFQYDVAMATIDFLNAISDNVRLGILAGSIGSGYNVGSVYSNRQYALSDLMEKQANGTYDFKDLSSVDTAFDYYMSPILGKISALEGVPKTNDEWVQLFNDRDNGLIISNSNVKINDDFLTFITDLSETQMNAKGLKITDTIDIRGGVTRFQDVRNSTPPKSVLSYNMTIAYPYIFVQYGENYKLDTNALRIEENYTYCIYNDRIYNSAMEEVTNRAKLGIERSKLYLFKQVKSADVVVGVILVGQFDECVVDTTTSGNGTYYATGRKIGFSNGYSDLLTLDKANVNLMYNTREGGKEGYLPKNVAFLVTDEEEEILKENLTLLPQYILENPDSKQNVTAFTNGETETFIKQNKNHLSMNSKPRYIKFLIVLDEIINESEDAAIKDLNLSEEELKTLDMNHKHYAFLIFRNNYYINDSSLLNWLTSDTARSIAYVDASTLYAKITGNFTKDLSKITYEDWKIMQQYKKELEKDKNQVVVSLLNITSMIMGIFLIVFSVLICVFYWIDIFNTFSRFSFMQLISFGNLYPVEDKEFKDFVDTGNKNTRYVTFKETLIIAFICCALGIIFLNVESLVYFITYIYHYILGTLGGI